MADDTDRASTLRTYNEYRTALTEAQELLAFTPDDAETQTYIEEIREVLVGLATSLNQSDGIVVESGGALRPHRDASTQDVVAYSLTTPATYEVFFDGLVWYSCAVVSVVPPVEPTERNQYRVAILGYGTEETVHSESLRLWQPPSENIAAKTKCHAICPTDGTFKACVVDRVSPNGTVVVTFVESSAVAEVPLTHVRTGKVYRTLMKRNKDMTDEERKARNASRKRERSDLKKQMMGDLLAQDSSDWQRLLDSVTPGAAPKVARKEGGVR